MTRKNDTLWEHGMSCVLLLALTLTDIPSIPRESKKVFTLIVLILLFTSLFFDIRKRSGYSEGELEREKQDERNRSIHMQAVWCCHVAEDWVLLGAYLVFGLFLLNETVLYALKLMLAGRCLLTFALRWWLDRKY